MKSRKLRLEGRPTFQNTIYGGTSVTVIKSDAMDSALDLALCVFHSYTVNAPSVAFKLLEDVMKRSDFPGYKDASVDHQYAVAFELLKVIKAKKYGRWDKRWERTRKAAMDVGWWPKGLFKRSDSLMTK